MMIVVAIEVEIPDSKFLGVQELILQAGPVWLKSECVCLCITHMSEGEGN